MSPAHTSARATLFGKLPAALDYVRVNHDSTAAVAFDGWLQSALQFLAGRDTSWPAKKLRFAYRSVARADPLVGVVAPSRDRAGRRFPIALFATAPAMRTADDGALALASERFLSDVERTLDELAGLSLPEVTAAIERVACLEPTEVADAVTTLEALLAGPAQALLDLLPHTTEATPYARVEAAVRAVRELAPYRHLVWDLPARCAQDRARWLALHRRAAAPDAVISWFWSEGDSEPRLLLVTGAVPPALPFWAASPSTRHERLLSLRTNVAAHADSSCEEGGPSCCTLQDLAQTLAAVGR
jgi:type VI secretion system ImpM family protein